MRAAGVELAVLYDQVTGPDRSAGHPAQVR